MKRGESGLSLLVAVDKPRNMSSHDVVNACRRIFGERRIGHTGTLDPLATGVLPICVGPAAKLDRFMTAHDKRYRATIAFGFETDTDDSEGVPIEFGNPRAEFIDEEFAQAYLNGLVGEHSQVPPRYSSIKVDGKRSYQAARRGEHQQLEPRPIEVYTAQLVEVFECEIARCTCWAVDFSVSKGTYIRALARDIGRDLDCPAHLSALVRLQACSIALDDCVSLESLESLGVQAALDPIAVLGCRYAFADEYDNLVSNGARLEGGNITLFEPIAMRCDIEYCSCASSIVNSTQEPYDGELVGMVIGNRLKALYSYSADREQFVPECVFAVAVSRG